MPFTALGLPPALEQQGEFLIAADDRRHAPACLAANRLSSARSPSTAKAGVGPVDALEGLRPELAQHEQIADQATGRLGNDHHARLGRALEACGKVRRIAHHRLLLRRPFADEVADDHKAGGDADTRRQGLACGLGQSADRC